MLRSMSRDEKMRAVWQKQRHHWVRIESSKSERDNEIDDIERQQVESEQTRPDWPNSVKNCYRFLWCFYGFHTYKSESQVRCLAYVRNFHQIYRQMGPDFTNLLAFALKMINLVIRVLMDAKQNAMWSRPQWTRANACLRLCLMPTRLCWSVIEGECQTSMPTAPGYDTDDTTGRQLRAGDRYNPLTGFDAL